MKKIIISAILFASSYTVKAQYCTSSSVPDYREIINHSHESSYKPCQNQSRKAWFYMQQQRIEQRMKELQKDHADDIRSIAKVYIDYVKEYYDWTYETRAQFEKGINFLNNMDKVLNQVELGQLRR